MAERLITIATFSQPIMAELAKTRLKAEGIDCFIADENIVTMNPFYSPAVGGVKLQVRESDIQRALGVLRQRSDAIDSGSTEDKSGNITGLMLFAWGVTGLLTILLGSG